MTTTEFSNEFDLLYDNASKGAPGLDLYEKSVFLTTAQDQIVKEAYSGATPTGIGFEGNERRRRQMSELVRDYKATTVLSDTVSIDKPTPENLINTSQFFGLPGDLMYIVLEKVKLKSTDSCLNNKIIPVTPVTHDEFQVQINNPFRKPSKRRAWRLDLYRSGNGQKAELFAPTEIREYHIRYVKRPKPILLANFESEEELQGLGLTVDGANVASTSELNTEIHRDILTRAVQLAVLASRENNLGNNMNANQNSIN